MNKLILLAVTAASLLVVTNAIVIGDVTEGATPTLKKGATITVSNIGAATNHLCWTSAASSVTAATCATAAGSANVDLGSDGCSEALSSQTVNLVWSDNSKPDISIIECDQDGSTAVGIAVGVAVTETNMAVTQGATPSLKNGATVDITGLTGTNWVCWAAATSGTPSAACAANGSPSTDIGAATGCSAAASSNAVALTWTTVANVKINVIECSSASASLGTAVDITVTPTNIAASDATIAAGATVAVTGLTTGNHLCWTAGTAAGDVTSCSAIPSTPATDIGQSGCGAANDADLAWTTVAGTHIAIQECSGITKVGTEVDIVLTDKNFVVSGGNAQTLAKGAAVTITGAQSGNHLCWGAGTSAGSATCAAAGTATDIGATSGCGAAGDFGLTWTTVANEYIAIRECDTSNANVGEEVDIVLTEANIAITGGAAQVIVAGAAVAVTELGSGNHLCWTAATSATAITSCSAAGTANDAGTSGCGAADDASLVWTTVSNSHVSIIQCAGTNTVGSAVATVLTQQIEVASANITAGADVTVTGLTTGNHLCWTAGTSAGSATCAAAGTATDIGTTGCGAANDADLTWTTVAGTHIAIRECDTSNANVGDEVDFILEELTTTTAAPASTTISGASTGAVWSAMVTVLALMGVSAML